MNIHCRRFASVLAGMASAVVPGLPAMADDTELFLGSADMLRENRPNIVLVIGPVEKPDIVKGVVTQLLHTLSDVNIGLVYARSDESIAVAHAVEDIAAARSSLMESVDALQTSGDTSLTESVLAAARYVRGEAVGYASPIESRCQKNFIVYLGDGEPARDSGANAAVRSLTAQHCGNTDGDCLPTLARFLHESDQSALEGMQNVTTYMIGADVDHPLLAETARAGGGTYLTAREASQLSTELSRIAVEIQNRSRTFTAPTVVVNRFNALQHLNDLYIGVFRPSHHLHWPGNLKKFRLEPATGAILDAAGRAAVDPATGLFAGHARDAWSLTDDGADVEAGGAADRLPAPDARRVYTYLGTATLTAAGNQVEVANVALDADLLGLGDGAPARDDLIAFMRGLDVAAGAPRRQMGDPLHAQPAAVVYGTGSTRILFATNDGYLHSIDAESGVEQWAFIPPEFLDDQIDLFLNPEVAARHYGLDGDLVVQIVANRDGVATSGEKVYLYFGMRRGGDVYYALDVSRPDEPAVMWARSFPGGGQSWSPPVPTRIDIGGSNRLVLVIGGGYSTAHDTPALTGTDAIGNAIHIVDALTGEVLWHGSNTRGDQRFDAMTHALPAGVKVIDMDGDGLADRMYASDMGGQVWRFDIRHGHAAHDLVAGGVIAQLGGAPAEMPPVESTRRFYYPPDVALVSATPSFLHIGIGSGHRARPNSVATRDRFYALRDYHPFRAMPQAYYDALAPVTDADLEDITTDLDATVPPNAAGWKLRFGAQGEKVLAEARTFDNHVYFTTFTPGTPDGDGCTPAPGSNRLYVVNVLNGAPVNNLDGSIDGDTLTATDRHIDLHGSISSAAMFVFPSPDDPGECVGSACSPPPLVCVDLECFPVGYRNVPVRTLWTQDRVD